MDLRRFTIAFMTVLIPTALLIALIFTVDYQSTIASKWQALIQQQINAVDAGRQAIENDIDQVIGDIHILSSSFQVFEKIDQQALKTFESQFLFFSQNKPRYDQIRFLNNKGMEVIRVDHTENGYSVLKNKNNLQDKSSRYYFQQARYLPQENVYISSIDWNMENGEIEQPLKPTIRFAMPVFNKQGQQQGVVVINYLASHIISRFVEASALHQQQLFLVNNQGQLLYLRDNTAGTEWILGEVKRFTEVYPTLWQEIAKNLQGQIKVDNGYYTFTSIKPMSLVNKNDQTDKNQKNWILISQLLPSALDPVKAEFFESNISLYAAIGLVCIIILLTYTRVQLRHQDAVKLNQYEQRFRQILDALTLAAVIIHPNGRLIYVNKCFLRQLGYEDEDLLNKDWCQSLMFKDKNTEQQIISTLIENPQAPQNEQQAIELHIQNSQGQARCYRWSKSFFTEIVEDRHYLTLIGDDITEQKELAIERDKLSKAVEQAPVTVMITDVNGVINYINPNFVEITGYRVEETLGRTPSFLQSPKHDHNESQILWQTLLKGETWHGEFCNLKKNGEEYWESASISPVKNERGENIAFIAVKRDITKERLFALKLEQEKRDKLKHEHDAAVGRMAYMIAHDLRNPLSTVKMTIQMLPSQVAENSSDIAELSEISLEQIRYMEEILTSLLAYARPDKDKHQWIAINDIITTALQSEEREILQYNVGIDYSYEENLPLIHADATKMQQVFQNLIANAIQATTENNQQPKVNIAIKFAMMETGEKLLITINNNGKSIDPFMSKKIFEPFFTTKAKGTGLGLAIVKNILDFYQGKIYLTPDVQEGTCCTVILPLAHFKNG